MNTTAGPDLINVTADAAEVEIGALINIHPDLNTNAVNAVMVPSGVLGSLALVGVDPVGRPLFRGSFPVDASSAGTIDFLSTAAYNADPRRARGMVSIDVVQGPVGPCLPPDCIVVIPDPDPFDTVRINVEYFPGVGGAQADQVAAEVSASTLVDLTLVNFQAFGNIYTYEFETDSNDVVDNVLDQFSAQVDLVESALRDFSVGSGE